MPAKDNDGGRVVALRAHPSSIPRQHALGCPLVGCDWRSPPFPATGRAAISAVKAYVWHFYTAHPQYRGLIDDARAAVQTEAAQ